MIEIIIDDEKFLKVIEEFNKALAEIHSLFIGEIPLNLYAATTTVEHCVCAFEHVCNSLLGRVINLSDNYCDTINRKEALAAAIICRALMESISHFHHLLYKITNFLNVKEYGKIYHILTQYILGGDHGFEKEKKKFGKIHVSDALASIDKKWKCVSETYNWLSEFVHPNSLGIALTFAKVNKIKKKIFFYQKPIFEKSLSPALEGAIYLPIFLDDWKEVPAIKLRLQKEWQPIETSNN